MDRGFPPFDPRRPAPWSDHDPLVVRRNAPRCYKGDLKEVARLTSMIQDKVALEQQWHEEKLAHIRTMKTANASHPR
jgi:hypothetical protein